MRYALIGCGRISLNHIVAAQKNGLEIVALCDINKDSNIEKAKKFNLPCEKYLMQIIKYVIK